jgi:hypothetical protein
MAIYSFILIGKNTYFADIFKKTMDFPLLLAKIGLPLVWGKYWQVRQPV